MTARSDSILASNCASSLGAGVGADVEQVLDVPRHHSKLGHGKPPSRLGESFSFPTLSADAAVLDAERPVGDEPAWWVSP